MPLPERPDLIYEGVFAITAKTFAVSNVVNAEYPRVSDGTCVALLLFQLVAECNREDSKMARILIAGGGFGGLVTAEILAERLGKEHQITMIAPNRFFTFYPKLVQVAFGAASPEEIRFDLESRLRELNVQFIQGKVVDIDAYCGKVKVIGEDLSGKLAYDFLVLAIGPKLAVDNIPGYFEHSHHLLGVAPALRFRHAIDHFQGGNIVLGMCPGSRSPVAICETAFALASRFENEIAAEEANIRVIFPQSLDEAFGGAHLSAEVERAFSKHGINVLYDIAISEVTEDDVYSTEGHRIHHDLLMLMPPFRGHEMFRSLGAADPNDFIQVDGHMRVKGLLNVFAVGDAVAFSGPKFAHMAVRQAQVAAENLIAEIKGEPMGSEYYHEIATVINAGGPESIYLHYGIWDDELYRLKQGRFWGFAKEMHDSYWQANHT